MSRPQIKLQKLPIIEQRSVEWYNVRNNLVTASDMGQALGVGKFGTVRDFYVKKSGYENDQFCTFPAESLHFPQHSL